MMTILLLVILAVGVFTASTLYRIERRLAAWQAEHRVDPVAFTPDELARQRLNCDQAAWKVQEVSDEVQERWGGKKFQSAEDEAEHRRQLRELESLCRVHNGAARHLSMMVRANARVRLGRDLLSDAIDKVHTDHAEQMHLRLQANLDAIKDNPLT